jgi:hypothetical protein
MSKKRIDHNRALRRKRKFWRLMTIRNYRDALKTINLLKRAGFFGLDALLESVAVTLFLCFDAHGEVDRFQRELDKSDEVTDEIILDKLERKFLIKK